MKTLDAMVKLDEVDETDSEAAHFDADAVLIKFMKEYSGDCREVAECWERAKSRCDFWYA